VYDARDSESGFERYLHRLARCTRAREESLGRTYPDLAPADDLRQVVHCLRHDFDLVPGLADLVLSSRRELVSLSDQQYHILDYALHEANPRVLCPGGAGTGKTLLAVEAARRIASRGDRVLVLCFNRVLADHLKSQLLPNPRLTVDSLHRFMRSVVEKGGMMGQLEALREAKPDDELYKSDFPCLFEEAVLNVLDDLEPFDALVIDEGQDILFSPVIDSLGAILEGGLDGGRWLIFYDPELQAEVYGRMDATVLGTLSEYRPALLPLKENFRNPRGIVAEMCAVTGIEPPTCRRELHSRVEYLTFDAPADEGARLRSLLVDLLRERVSPGAITILAGSRREDCCVSRHSPEVGKHIVFVSSPQVPPLSDDVISACTVPSFKGLENDVIVLTDLGAPFGGSTWQRSVVYVGMTRARTKVYAIVPKGFVERRFAPASSAEGGHA